MYIDERTARKRIEELEEENESLRRNAPDRRDLRADINALLDWLVATRKTIEDAAVKIDPTTHPNSHPPTFVAQRGTSAPHVSASMPPSATSQAPTAVTVTRVRERATFMCGAWGRSGVGDA